MSLIHRRLGSIPDQKRLIAFPSLRILLLFHEATQLLRHVERPTHVSY